MSQDKMLVILVVIISIIALISFFLSPFFQLRDITVNGLKNLTQKEINSFLSGYYKENIWLIDKNEVKKELLQNKYIKSVKIEKKYPASLALDIKERVPLGKINNNGRYLIFDKEGFIIEKGSQKSRIQVPEIKGTGYTFVNNSISFTPVLKKIVQALRIIDFKTREKIKIVSLKNNSKIVLKLYSQIYVYMGKPEEIRRKFKVLESVSRKIGQENLVVDYIDLRIIERPVIKLKK